MGPNDDVSLVEQVAGASVGRGFCFGESGNSVIACGTSAAFSIPELFEEQDTARATKLSATK